MRTISAISLAKLAQRQGTEPIVVIEVSWTDDSPNGVYGDRSFPGYGIQGRILSVRNLEDVINYGKNGTVQNVSILLDDTDGGLKGAFDNVDIHRRPVWIYQWFSDIPYSERFLLFAGVISSPIIWKESDRTLEFDVLSKAIDAEIGFSAEDGFFPFVPLDMIGKAWPLIFGAAMQVPALRVDALPHGQKVGSTINSVTQDPFGIHDPSLDHQIKEHNLTYAFAVQLAFVDFIEYLAASFTARERGELDEFADISTGKGPFSQLAQQLLKQGNDLLAEAGKINSKNGVLKGVLAAQKLFEEQQIGLTNGELFPLNQTVSLNINGAVVTGYFDSSGNFNVLSSTHPADELTTGMIQEPDLSGRTGDPVITRNAMFFADAGTPVFYFDQVLGEEVGIVPIRYIVAAVIPVNIIAISAFRTVPVGTLYGEPGPSFRGLYPIPSSYYSVNVENFGPFGATVVTFPGPLSARGEGWEDEIYCNLQSEIGPNVVDVIIWVIENYTDLTYDAASFATVRPLVDPYPVNFAMLDRPQAIKFIQEVAYQSRCIVFVKNEVFFIKYLAQIDTIVDSITEDDIILSSLSIEVTETEDLITKYIAEWEPDYLGKNVFKIILRYNINKYGLQEKTYKYFIYNQQILVDISATFWMIRSSNSYKIVKFRTPIHKLNLETLDTINLAFTHPFVANGTVQGIIQKASFDSDKFEIEFEVWTNVRLGEMIPYPFFYTAGLSEQDVYPTQFDIDNGNVAVPGVKLPDGMNPFSGDPGNGGTVKIGPHKTMGFGLTDYGPDGNDQPEINTGVDSTSIVPVTGGKKPPGTTMYQYDKIPTPTQITGTTAAASNTNPGIVTGSNGDGTYTCDWYQSGLGNSPTAIAVVKVVVIDSSDTVPNGTGVMITQITYTQGQNSITEYYMQPPVWAASS